MKIPNLFQKTQQTENAQIKAYFEQCMESIDLSNQYMMRKVCMYASIIYLFLLLMAKFAVPSFGIHPVHFLIMPLLVVYFFINLHIRKPTVHLSTHMTGITCGIFYSCLVFIIMLFDVIAVPERPAVWTPLVIALFPMVYIDRMFKYGIEELVAILTYAVLAYFNKIPSLFRREMYMLMAAYVLSMLSAHIILVMRSREGLAMLELKQVSSLDKLTHVLNKGALLQRLEYHYLHKKPEEPCALLMLDLDNFKEVNDNLGHDAGDRLLERVGQLLIDNFRAYDIIGRYGGDEFVVLMPKMSNPVILEMRCKSLQMFLTDFNLGNGQPFTVSIGGIVDQGEFTYQEIFRMADDALYISKLKGKSCYTTWIVDNKELSDKPYLVLLANGEEEKVCRLYENEINNFEIITAVRENDALRCISQWHENIKLVVVEMSMIGEDGFILKYLKKRESFIDIPILAVASSPEERELAKKLGANEILMNDSPDEHYHSAVAKLVRM